MGFKAAASNCLRTNAFQTNLSQSEEQDQKMMSFNILALRHELWHHVTNAAGSRSGIARTFLVEIVAERGLPVLDDL
jgi:hypothetical protein